MSEMGNLPVYRLPWYLDEAVEADLDEADIEGEMERLLRWANSDLTLGR